MSKSMGALGEPGQILTYTCHPGFVFVDDPVPVSQTALTSSPEVHVWLHQTSKPGPAQNLAYHQNQKEDGLTDRGLARPRERK